jgi:hypothetical protein
MSQRFSFRAFFCSVFFSSKYFHQLALKAVGIICSLESAFFFLPFVFANTRAKKPEVKKTKEITNFVFLFLLVKTKANVKFLFPVTAEVKLGRKSIF